MTEYYVDREEQENGYHEVHTADCDYLPDSNDRLYLGPFTTGNEAVRAAKKYYLKTNGCPFCSPECHINEQ